MKNRVFFPQSLLDLLMDSSRIDIHVDELKLTESGARYRVVEAVRILREVTDGIDPHDLCGKVKSRRFLTELGAELLGDSMIVGEKAYDVLSGFVALPVGEPSAGESEEAVLTALAADTV
jgi:hypothetical protein